MLNIANALTGVFLWLVFGLMSGIVNCDLQRLMRTSSLFFHAMGYVAFVFLFTMLDSTSHFDSVLALLAQSAGVYLLFLLVIKSKWFFVLPVLLLLLMTLLIKKDIAIREARKEDIDRYKKIARLVDKIVIFLVIVIAAVGTLHYMHLQRLEYGSDFSWRTFFFGVTICKPVMPNYADLAKKKKNASAS